jgi:transposase-like protein
MDELSIPALAEKIPTEADAYRLLEDLRWDGRPICPHCGSVRQHYFLKPSNGTARRTRTGSMSQRRVWKCADCRKQFSVLTGTIFHGTKIPVRKWLFVIFEMCSSKNGVAAREIQRKYDLTEKSAWFMLHRIREAMKREPLAGLLSGRVVADETWIGGKPSNRHGHNPKERMQGPMSGTKQPVMALISRETGEVRSQAVPNVNGSSLRAVLDDHVDPTATHLHTDSAMAYKRIVGDFASHSTVDHSAGEYARGDVSTNQAEAFFSQLKRSIDGTHHHVSHEHLARYLAEFDFRFSTCKESDTARMQRLLGQVNGRRLTYRHPSSKAAQRVENQGKLR